MSPSIACRIAFPLAALALVLAQPPFLVQPAMAEDSVNRSIEKTGQALSLTEDALVASRRAKAMLDAQVAEAKQEVLRVRREQVDAAAEAQDIEARMSALESHLEALEAERREKLRALSRRRGELTQTLAALQRIGRTPPDLLIFMPASIQEISRSRLLLGAVAGQLDARANLLGDQLLGLAHIGEEISAQRKLIDVEADRLGSQRAHLGVLLARKTRAYDRTEAQYGRAEALVADLADEAGSLQELLDRLVNQHVRNQRFQDQAGPAQPVAAAEPAQPAVEAEPAQQHDEAKQAQPFATTEPAQPAVEAKPAQQYDETEPDQQFVTAKPARPPTSEPESRPGVTLALADMAADSGGERGASPPPSALSPPAGEVAPSGEIADDGDIGQLAALAPLRPPVSAARGAFAMPARGKLVSRFDETTALGLSTKGIVIETRLSAQIVAPYDGRVAFAGHFREYGLLLIIDHGEGYHTLLAGIGRIDVLLGQHVLAGEPVGVMQAIDGAKPRLYVELRSEGRPINPLPWLAAETVKVSG